MAQTLLESQSIMPLPAILSTSVVDESQTINVESNILEANSFNWVDGRGGTAVWVIPKKGTVLHGDSHLVFKAKWNGYQGTNTTAVLTCAADGAGAVAPGDVTVVSGGTGYSVDDPITIKQLPGAAAPTTAAVMVVNSVNANGGIVDFKLGTAGAGYANNEVLIAYAKDWDLENVVFPSFGGGAAAIKNCRLYIDGKLITELRDANEYLALRQNFTPWEHRTHLFDKTLGSNTRYHSEVGTSGQIKLFGEPSAGSDGCRVLQADNNTLECSIALDKLFGILLDGKFPVSMIQGDVRIEIDFEGRYEQALVQSSDVATITCTATAGGAINVAQIPVVDGGLGYAVDDVITVRRKPGATGTPTTALANVQVATVDVNGSILTVKVGTAGAGYNANEQLEVVPSVPTYSNTSWEIVQPRLMLDFVYYSPEQHMALAQDMATKGIQMVYREITNVKKQLPAVAAGASSSTDLELGWAGRQVMGLYVSKHNQAHSNGFLRNFRSDKLNGEEYNLIVNNKLLYDKPVSRDPEAYNYLSSLGGYHFGCVPGAFEIIGKQRDDTQDFLSNNCYIGSDSYKADIQNNVQGRQKYLGFNLAKFRNGKDSPLNSIRIGSTPIILRMKRTGLANADTSATQNQVNESQGAVAINMWCVWVRLLSIKNGLVNVANF